MKRLSLLAGLLCFVFIACCPKAETEQKQEEVVEKQGCSQKETKCCKNMTEEQKAACKEFCEKWKDFENQSEEVQKELVLQAKTKIDACEAKMAAEKAEFEAKWANFDNLPVDEQKALIDKKMNCKKGGCKKGGEGKKCQKPEGKAKCGKH